MHYWASPLEGKLCAGHEVALVGGGNSAGQAVVYLAVMLDEIFGPRSFVSCFVWKSGKFRQGQTHRGAHGGPKTVWLDNCRGFMDIMQYP